MREDKTTILGAGGWIGKALVSQLHGNNQPVEAVGRRELPDWLTSDHSPGTVIFAIGLTSDFREKPHATIEAHVNLVSQVLQKPNLKQLLFLSSTRVYARSTSTSERDPLPCLSSDPSDLYNLSKLLGESLILQDKRMGLKVARISNVIGPHQPQNTFIGQLRSEANRNGFATIRQPPHWAKDYIGMDDVVRLLPLIASRGKHRLYNLGSGQNTSNLEVAQWLSKQNLKVNFINDNQKGGLAQKKDGTELGFPCIDITRLTTEFTPPKNPFI